MRLGSKKFFKDEGGQFAVQFAVLAVPLLVMITFGTDHARAGAEEANIKSALDAAVIAAVSNNSLSIADKEIYAVKHFEKNYSGSLDLTLTPKAQNNRVDMSAKGYAPVSLAAMAGVSGIALNESSAATMAKENVICVLSLAPDGKDRINFSQNITFSAPTCSVHANSIDPAAISITDTPNVRANHFCAVGGAKGNFQPFAKGDCAPVPDPYANHIAPEPGPCVRSLLISDKRNRLLPIPNYTGSFIKLYPGTYCGGLTVNGLNVTFAPGAYIMLDGKLVFESYSKAEGDGVTFVMNGKKSTLSIKSHANVNLTAPKEDSGLGMPGLVFFQDVQSDLGKKAKNLPNGKNEIASGGNLNITGTAYFPTQTIEITADSVFGSQAPATSMIAYNMKMKGDANININVDHRKAGLPPLLPRSEDGAYLVK